MARKRQRSEPQVPRSSIQAGSPVQVVESEGGSAPVRSGPRNISTTEFHQYVKNDLTRIAIFGTLIFAGMIAMKFVGF